ncbi:Down syndrome cell adhesion molecule-like protein Dscam2 [Hyalella azteca]|uniref:Down syndrome cell adhesion molecule-like protein Dscam2 n=1 Tax=Hyalella azteca TaxID=294128 RepID=A0A979FR08_HYAAZ|nr:Down syndrome cell adhesion molecule-like protein Dscam2 [Hyalella azteca]
MCGSICVEESIREVPSVWVTASTSAGEGPPSSRITLTPKHSPNYPPLILGGRSEWWVTKGGGLTLGCRRAGHPEPTIEWDRNGGALGEGEQLLPGGDVHLREVKESGNYTCTAVNNMGVDRVTHVVHVTTPPPPPVLTLTHATHSSLNVTITTTGDGGAPILGYTVHYRLPSGSWQQQATPDN